MKFSDDIGGDSNLDVSAALAAGDSFIAAMEDDVDDTPVLKRSVTPAELRLVNKKVPIRYHEFKITNTAQKMLQSETISISNRGVMLNSAIPFSPGTILRVWVEMPDYWARKSRHVAYRHTNAPTYFQILSRVITCDDISKRTAKYQIFCENVNLDPVDETVLCEFLGVECPKRENSSRENSSRENLNREKQGSL